MQTPSRNNRFVSFLKTHQFSIFSQSGFDLLEATTIKKSNTRLIKKYCLLYVKLIQTYIKKNLEGRIKKDKNNRLVNFIKKRKNRRWILTKRKTRLTTFACLNTKADYGQFRPIYLQGYTPQNEFIYGFRNIRKIQKPKIFQALSTFEKCRDKKM